MSKSRGEPPNSGVRPRHLQFRGAPSAPSTPTIPKNPLNKRPARTPPNLKGYCLEMLQKLSRRILLLCHFQLVQTPVNTVTRSFSSLTAGKVIRSASGRLHSTRHHRPLLIQSRGPKSVVTMTSSVAHYSIAGVSGDKPKGKPPMDPRPSASLILLSPTNQVLLVHRVKTSSAFASAHVFPGGNLSEFHDGAVPPAEDPARHQDGRPYRLGAVRETFEETGVLLARGSGGALLSLPAAERDAARKRIYANEISFEEWLKIVGGEADLGEHSMTSIDTLSPRTNYWLFRKPASLYTVDHTTSHAKEIHYPNVPIHASIIWFRISLTRCIRHRRSS